MNKRIFAGLLSALFFFFATPIAHAADIPLMTWERGKEQNIVLGGAGLPSSWNIRLVGAKTSPVAFSRSAPNAKGFVVFSTQIPSDFPLGSYTVEVFDQEGTSGSIVAGVNIIALATYSIVRMPTDLKIVSLSLIFLITLLSALRSRRYSHYEFTRRQSLIEDQSLVHNRRFPGVLYKLYVTREKSLAESRQSFFWFLANRDGALLHKISPLLWTLFPLVGVIAGLISGLVANADILNLPFYFVAVLAIISALDVYSGLFAMFGFLTSQIVLGQITNLREGLIVLSFAVGIAFAGLVGDLVVLTSEHDTNQITNQQRAKLVRTFNLWVGAATVAGFFYFTQILEASLSLSVRKSQSPIIVTAIFIFLLFIFKNYYSTSLDRKLIAGDHALVTENFEITRVFQFGTVFILAIVFTSITFIWSNKLSIAAITGAVLTAPFVLISVRFSRPRLAFLQKLPRNVLIEAFVVTGLSLLLFIFINSRPMEVIQKSELLLAIGFLPALIHALACSLYDVSGNIEVGAAE